jgi:rare lipoprotein A
MENLKKFIALLSIALLASCAGNSTIKPEANTAATSSQSHASKPPLKPGAGGYYLDDGPGDNAPADIDGIPDAQLKTEVPLVRANKPYIALGQQYIPMTSYIPYKKQGIASWYGKKYHGKKTSTGEIYDMYGMSGAHTVLPIPSYAKVTNPANGRSVIVRINDRGPFKHDRLIDLSYAAAYKLRLINQGSGLVEVETIDTSAEAMLKMAKPPVAIASTITTAPTSIPASAATNMASALEVNASPAIATPLNTSTNSVSMQYYVQAGAFKSEANGDLLLKKIQGLQLAENVEVANVYNNALYRVRLGPYTNRKEADVSAASIRRQLNIPAIVQN